MNVTKIALTLALAGVALVAPVRADDDPYALEGNIMRDANNVKLLTRAGKAFTKRFDEGKNEADLGKAEHYLERAAKLDPNDPVVKARYAIARALRAREKNAKSMAQGAVKDLDAAVASAPENLLVRELRGFVAIELPSDFNKMDQGIADLEQVEKAYKADPSVKSKFELDVAKLYFKLGKGYRARGKLPEAKKAWEAAIASEPNSFSAKSATNQLKKFK